MFGEQKFLEKFAAYIGYLCWLTATLLAESFYTDLFVDIMMGILSVMNGFFLMSELGDLLRSPSTHFSSFWNVLDTCATVSVFFVPLLHANGR